MIFVTLANALFKIFTGLLSFINLPQFPSDLTMNFDKFMDLVITNGMTLLTFVYPSRLLSIALPLVVAIIFAEDIYHFVMWIVRKIPILGMS